MKTRKATVGGDEDGERLNVEKFSDIEAKPVEWLWPGRIAFSSLTVFSEPIGGEVFMPMLAEIAANFTGKNNWPADGLVFRERKGVLYSGKQACDFGRLLSRAGAHMHEVRSAGRHGGDPYEELMSALDAFPSCGMMVTSGRVSRNSAMALRTVARDRGLAVVSYGEADEIAGLATTVLSVSMVDDPIYPSPRGTLRVVRSKHGETAAPLVFWVQQDETGRRSQIDWYRV